MKRKHIMIPLLASTLILVSMFSGCVGPWAVDTLGWDHINPEGTAVRIWGQLTITESHENWNEFFVWDTEYHADWHDYGHFVEADNYAGWGLFSLDVSGLDRHTTYHYRAIGEYLKAQNQIRVGEDHTFIPGGPRVTTDNVSMIGLYELTLEGDLWHLGGATYCNVFFRYGTDIDNLNHESSHQNLTNIGQYSATITGLTANTTIFYKAVAINDADTWDGLIFQATPGQPIVVTRQPGQITSTSALLKAELWHTGGTTECDVWFAYSDTSPNVLDETTEIITMNTTGAFEIPLENLTPGTKYWYRAVADNGYGVDKGEIYEFTTTTGNVILTDGELGSKYISQEKDTHTSFIEKLPVQYQQILKDRPVLLRLLHYKVFQQLFLRLL